MTKRLSILVIAALLLPMAVTAQTMTPSVGVRVGPRDVLDVRVVQDPSLNTRATVTSEGVISMPIIGKVEVSGLNARQIEQRIKSVLESRVLKVADVAVEIVELGARPISVVGAVTRPGTITTTGDLTLIQAITQAGGLAPGYGRTLYIVRTGLNGLTEQLAIDIDDLMVNGNPDLNLPLEPNDLVNIPVEAPVTIYLLGEVMRPGKVELRRTPTPTLLQAIAAAGGPTDRAGARAIIKRAGATKPLTFNYRRIAEGDAPDIPLQDGDTISLKESFF